MSSLRGVILKRMMSEHSATYSGCSFLPIQIHALGSLASYINPEGDDPRAVLPTVGIQEESFDSGTSTNPETLTEVSDERRVHENLNSHCGLVRHRCLACGCFCVLRVGTKMRYKFRTQGMAAYRNHPDSAPLGVVYHLTR